MYGLEAWYLTGIQYFTKRMKVTRIKFISIIYFNKRISVFLNIFEL